ncbi:MAG: 7-cyano-7-deazaguanine synthase QueC [Candidatus Omnitrophota bacterium]|jgi:7-cyano-7-deazaguanine synthase|nr:MAG: 7-cyano-7-deazaguanine synthase QueC [Candidatus Omnitrophota bacterium]
MKDRKRSKRAVVLLSGGLDSATTLYIARRQGFECFCLIFDYGQRHKKEINSAKMIAASCGCKLRLIKISLPWKGSSLIDKGVSIPLGRLSGTKEAKQIPSTYVPGRNIIFLSFALSFAEVIGASAIFIGAHSQDYSGYPDCRPQFYRDFKKVISSGTKAGVEGRRIDIRTPLILKNKAQIINMGKKLRVPFQLSWSCYYGGLKPCGKCDSCHFREKGFQEAGLKDPLLA